MSLKGQTEMNTYSVMNHDVSNSIYAATLRKQQSPETHLAAFHSDMDNDD